jgi:putative hydrolase of the HAD superfamily
MRDVLICDFGGVLTTPLQEGFLAYQEESGVSLEELGKAMGRAAEEHGDHPLFVLERGEITEAEFRARIEKHLEDGFDLARLRTLYFERLEPNTTMIEFVRELRERGVRAALLTNNVREWEPLWRAKLPEVDELFEVVVDSAFVDLRADTRAARRPRARAVRLPRRSRRQLPRGARPGHGGRPLRQCRPGHSRGRVSTLRIDIFRN